MSDVTTDNPNVKRFLPKDGAHPRPYEDVNGTILAIDFTAETDRSKFRTPKAFATSGWIDPLTGHTWLDLRLVADAYGDPNLYSASVRFGYASIYSAGGLNHHTLVRANSAGLGGATRWFGDIPATLPSSAHEVNSHYHEAMPWGGPR